ncbi:hypothetical protein Cantr_07358 [Candida viswanathii]|uniref:Nuclear pore complex protein n=1 Tax=Candida viswanathii TaxID=5486 RepID=A0A367XZU3_9ASCO|nr:hypothetical protein Cantr_07358 [Candida viswanathii]
MSTTIVPYDRNTSVEVQFAQALESFQLHKADPSVLPFDCIQAFKSVAATQALTLGTQLAEEGSKTILREQFDNWNLETKLWNLVEELYASRLEVPEPIEVHDYSSLVVKQRDFLSTHPKLKELWIIITWIQNNSLGFYDTYQQSKWQNTKIALENADVSVFVNQGRSSKNLVTSLDDDAPLRQTWK